MKVFKSLLIILAILLALSSCGTTPPEESIGSETQPPTESTSETESIETDKENISLDVVSNGKSDFSLIIPSELNGANGLVVGSFSKELGKRFSCEMKKDYDIMAMIKPPAADAKELIIGDTNREESKTIHSRLVEKGGERFGILVTDSKIAITGTSWYQLYLGLDHFLSTFSSTDESGAPLLSVEIGYEFISENSDESSFDIKTLVENGEEIVFAATDRVLRFEVKNGADTTQGGCTDGTFVYVGMMGKAESGEYGVILKYDMATGELISYSEKLPLYHNNDITYDSKNNRLVVATLDRGWYRLAFIDPETLTYIGDIDSPVAIRGIEYLSESNTYIAASGNIEIMLLDENFNKISSHICLDQTLMTQGLYSDGAFVYDPRYIKGKTVHLMVVEDMDGNLVASAEVYGLSSTEPEHFFKINGKFYMGCNFSNSLYEIIVMPKSLW